MRKSALALVITACHVNMAHADVFIFFDVDAFVAFNVAEGKDLKGIEDFEPPVSNLGVGELALLADPLQAGVPNVDADGLGFPMGLLNDNLFIQSNLFQNSAPFIIPGGGLVAIGPGGVEPGVPNSVKVGARIFAESIDLIFIGDHTGIGFTVEDPIAGFAHITVFDEFNGVLFDGAFDLPESPDPGDKFFFGIWSDDPIGRINVGGPGGELVDDIQMWIPAPGVLALFIVAGMVTSRRRRSM